MNSISAPGATEPAVFTAFRDQQVDGGLWHDQHARIATSDNATSIRVFHMTMMPGLLQSRGWAMGMAEHNPVLGYTVPDGQAAAEQRLARQRILAEPGRNIHILMGLAALRRAKPRPVFDEQVQHLVNATRATTYTFGVVPDFAGTIADPIGEFFLYDDRTVEIETVAGEVRSSHPEDVALCRRVFDLFAATARHGQPARDLLAGVAAEYPH